MSGMHPARDRFVRVYEGQASRFPLVANYAAIVLGRSTAGAPQGRPTPQQAMKMARSRLHDHGINPADLATLADLDRSTDDLTLAALAGLSAAETRDLDRHGWDDERLRHLAALRHQPLPPVPAYRIAEGEYGAQVKAVFRVTKRKDTT